MKPDPSPVSSRLPLPIREGVGPSYLWLPEGAWPDMLAFLSAHFSHLDPAIWLDRMARGEVVDGDGVRIAPQDAYRRGRCIYYYRELDAEPPIPFSEQILYRDAHLLVADKPHFLPVIPGGRFLHESLLVRLKKNTGLEHLTPIHRIDRETAGVVIFSHNLATRGLYQGLFNKRQMHKLYHAVAPCLAPASFPFTYRSRLVKGEPFFRMREEAGEPNSETRIDLLEQRGELCMYELRPITGRQHQLRVHLTALGIPILNDAFYPQLLPENPDDFSRPLQLLAKEISFVDPLSGAQRFFASQRKLFFPAQA